MSSPATAATQGKESKPGKALPAKKIVLGFEAIEEIPVQPVGSRTEVGKTNDGGNLLIEAPGGRVPWYSQNPGAHPPAALQEWTWAKAKMNPDATSPKVIADVGCGLTSAAMILSYFGYKVDPGELNTWAQKHGAYAATSNCIADWSLLFSYGGGGLTFDRGTWKNRRYLPEKQKDDAGCVQAFFAQARAQLEKGLPCIGRVDYVGDTTGSHAPWGDHFVVLVGVHRDGHLIINDPGRFCWEQGLLDLRVGHGARFPELRDNWVAVDPAQGTTKNGGYRLMRIDTITGKAVAPVVTVPAATPATPEPAADPDFDAEHWQQYAHGKVVQHLIDFGRLALEKARSLIAASVKSVALPAADADPARWPFSPSFLQLPDASVIETELLKATDQFFDVIEDVSARLGAPVAIKPPTFFSEMLGKVRDEAKAKLKGVVKTADRVIRKVAAEIADEARVLDLDTFVPAGGAVFKPAFLDLLVEAQKTATALGDGSLSIGLGRATQQGKEFVALWVDAGLAASLQGSGMKVEGFASLEGKGQLGFLFPDIDHLIDGAIAQVFMAVKLIENGRFNESLQGLVTAEDAKRLATLLEARAQLRVEVSTEGDFSLAAVPRALRGAAAGESEDQGADGEASLSAEAVVDFCDGKALLAFGGNTEVEVELGTGTVSVDLAAAGAFEQQFPKVRDLWGDPVGSFKRLVGGFTSGLDGKVAVEAKVKGEGLELGPLDLGADAELKLLFDHGTVAVDLGAAASPVLDLGGGNKLTLAVDAKAAGAFRLDKLGFRQFVEDPATQLPKLFQDLVSSATVAFNATTEGKCRFGPVSLDGGVSFGLQFKGGARPEATFRFKEALQAVVQLEDGQSVKLRLSGSGEVKAKVPLSAIWDAAREEQPQQLAAAFDAMVASLGGGADVTVSGASKQLSLGPVCLKDAAASFTLHFANGTVSMGIKGTSEIEVPLPDGKRVRVDVQGKAALSLKLPDPPKFADLWGPGTEPGDGRDGDAQAGGPGAALHKAIDGFGKALAEQALKGTLTLSCTTSSKMTVGNIDLNENAKIALKFAKGVATLAIDGGLNGNLCQKGKTDSDTSVRKYPFHIDASQALAVDLNDLGVERICSDPTLFGDLLASLPGRLLEASLAVGGDGSFPLGAYGTLAVKGGLKFDYSKAKQRWNLLLGSEATFKAKGLPLQADLSEAGEIHLQNVSLEDLLRDAEDGLGKVLDRLLDNLNGHARFEFGADLNLADENGLGTPPDEGKYPLARVRTELKKYGIQDLVVKGFVILDFRFDPADPATGAVSNRLTLQYGGKQGVRAAPGAAPEPLVVKGKIKGLDATFSSLGVFQIKDLSLAAFAADPMAAMDRISDQVLATMATTTTVAVDVPVLGTKTFKLEELSQAYANWSKGEVMDAAVEFWGSLIMS